MKSSSVWLTIWIRSMLWAEPVTQSSPVTFKERFKTRRVDPAIERRQVERLRALRDRRDARATEASLMKLEASARGDENVLPRILDCVETLATVGEISNRLRDVWGEYREAVTV